MITAPLAKKYDRLLNYYLSKPIDECLESHNTSAFVNYIEMLYWLEDKERIKNHYKTTLARLMIKEFVEDSDYKPNIKDYQTRKFMIENKRGKQSMLSSIKLEDAYVKKEGRIEVHDIYNPSFTTLSDKSFSRWIASDILETPVSPFNESASYISEITTQSDRTMDFRNSILKILRNTGKKDSTLMDRKKTLKLGPNKSSVFKGGTKKSLHKMASHAHIGLKSMFKKEDYLDTLQKSQVDNKFIKKSNIIEYSEANKRSDRKRMSVVKNRERNGFQRKESGLIRVNKLKHYFSTKNFAIASNNVGKKRKQKEFKHKTSKNKNLLNSKKIGVIRKNVGSALKTKKQKKSKSVIRNISITKRLSDFFHSKPKFEIKPTKLRQSHLRKNKKQSHVIISKSRSGLIDIEDVYSKQAKKVFGAKKSNQTQGMYQRTTDMYQKKFKDIKDLFWRNIN